MGMMLLSPHILDVTLCSIKVKNVALSLSLVLKYVTVFNVKLYLTILGSEI